MFQYPPRDNLKASASAAFLLVWLICLADVIPVHAEPPQVIAPPPIQLPTSGDRASTLVQKILVLNLETDFRDPKQADALIGHFRDQLQASGKFITVTPVQIEHILQEHPTAQGPCEGAECHLDNNQVRLVTGKVIQLRDRLWQVSVSLEEIPSRQVIRTVSFEHEGDFASLSDEGFAHLAEKLLAEGIPRRGTVISGQGLQGEPESRRSEDPIQLIPLWVWRTINLLNFIKR